jgi:hypothetical protein
MVNSNPGGINGRDSGIMASFELLDTTLPRWGASANSCSRLHFNNNIFFLMARLPASSR